MSTPATTTTGRPPLPDLKAISKQVVKEAGSTNLEAFFKANLASIQALLPKHMTAERMMRIMFNCLRTTPKLRGCTVQSLFGATIFCAQVGLEPNTPLGHIYLIPFESKRKGITEVQIVIGYKGYIELARRSGQVTSLHARVRYANDEWDMKMGTEDYIHHVPTDDEPGPVVGFYAVAKLKDGGVQWHYMPLKAVERIRDGSQGYRQAVKYEKTDSPWMTAFEEMGRKTVIRNLAKYLPLSIELAQMLELDDAADRGASQGLDRVLDGEGYEVQDGASEDPPAEEQQQVLADESQKGPSLADQLAAAQAKDAAKAPVEQQQAQQQEQAKAAPAEEKKPAAAKRQAKPAEQQAGLAVDPPAQEQAKPAAAAPADDPFGSDGFGEAE